MIISPYFSKKGPLNFIVLSALLYCENSKVREVSGLSEV